MREEGRKEMFYLTTHSTHFIYGYMASDIKDHSDSERGRKEMYTEEYIQFHLPTVQYSC